MSQPKQILMFEAESKLRQPIKFKDSEVPQPKEHLEDDNRCSCGKWKHIDFTLCVACEEIENYKWLECPECNCSNRESDEVVGDFSCDNCGLDYETVTCDSCEARIGWHYGDDGDCPKCFNKYNLRN